VADDILDGASLGAGLVTLPGVIRGGGARGAMIGGVPGSAVNPPHVIP
jgi:hypothetical protein